KGVPWGLRPGQGHGALPRNVLRRSWEKRSVVFSPRAPINPLSKPSQRPADFPRYHEKSLLRFCFNWKESNSVFDGGRDDKLLGKEVDLHSAKGVRVSFLLTFGQR